MKTYSTPFNNKNPINISSKIVCSHILEKQKIATYYKLKLKNKKILRNYTVCNKYYRGFCKNYLTLKSLFKLSKFTY